MSIHPSVQPTTPQGQVYDRIGDLAREVRNHRRARANQPQHGYASGSATLVSALYPGQTVCSVDLNVPSTDSNVIFLIRGSAATTDGTNAAHVGLTDSLGDWGGARDLAQITSTVGATFTPFVSPAAVGGVSYSTAAILPWDPYKSNPGLYTPATGAHTYSFVVYKDHSGAATVSATNVEVYALVL